jgi:perosamine synthetase
VRGEDAGGDREEAAFVICLTATLTSCMPRVTFPIHHTFGPLVTDAQWHTAFRLQFQPYRWTKGPEVEALRSELSTSFGMSAALFATGREALLALLRALKLSPGDEVIIQAFTCVAVPNAVHAAGANAVYCDIDPQTLNLDLRRLQSLITPRTKAVICQHTFGIPADTKKLRAICDRRRLILIEDCAHVIPDIAGDAQLSLLSAPSATSGIGAYGDALIMSFGRDKAISGVSGGAVLTRHSSLAKPVAQMERSADSLTAWQVLHLIGYPIRYRVAKKIWLKGIARLYLRWAQLFKLLPPVLTQAEKEGKMPITLRRLPNACAILALQQFKHIGDLNAHRRKVGALYKAAANEGGWNVPAGVKEATTLQKFPVFAQEAEKLRMELKREQIYLDDGWCSAVVNPQSVDQEKAGYAPRSCPAAEDVARHIVTLPLHPTMSKEQAKYLIHALRSSLG